MAGPAHSKPATHSRDHRDDHLDAISGPWYLFLDEGDTIPDLIDEDLVIFFENGAKQPPDDWEPFAIRRGISPLDFTGHIDCADFSSGDVAFTIPEALRLPYRKAVERMITDDGGTTWTRAGFVIDPDSGEVTISFPVT